MDLQIENETDPSYQLHLYITDKHLVGEWRTDYPQLYQYEVYEKKHSIQSAYWGGYIRHNFIQRRIYSQQKQFVENQYVTENHAIMMYEPLLACNSEKSQSRLLSSRKNKERYAIRSIRYGEVDEFHAARTNL